MINERKQFTRAEYPIVFSRIYAGQTFHFETSSNEQSLIVLSLIVTRV